MKLLQLVFIFGIITSQAVFSENLLKKSNEVSKSENLQKHSEKSDLIRNKIESLQENNIELNQTTKTENIDIEDVKLRNERDSIRTLVIPEGSASHSLYPVKFLTIGESGRSDEHHEGSGSYGGSVGGSGLLALPNIQLSIGGSAGLLSKPQGIGGSGGGGQHLYHVEASHEQPTHHVVESNGVHGGGVVSLGGSSGVKPQHGHYVEEIHVQPIQNGGSNGGFGSGIGSTGVHYSSGGIHGGPYHHGIGINGGGGGYAGGYGSGVFGGHSQQYGGVSGGLASGGVVSTGGYGSGIYGGPSQQDIGVHGGNLVPVGVVSTGGLSSGIHVGPSHHGGGVNGGGSGGIHGQGYISTPGYLNGVTLGIHVRPVHHGETGNGGHGGSSGTHEQDYHHGEGENEGHGPSHQGGLFGGGLLGNLLGGNGPFNSQHRPQPHHTSVGSGVFVEGHPYHHKSTPNQGYQGYQGYQGNQGSQGYQYPQTPYLNNPLFYPQPNTVVVSPLPSYQTPISYGSGGSTQLLGSQHPYTPWYFSAPQTLPLPLDHHQCSEGVDIKQPEGASPVQAESHTISKNTTNTRDKEVAVETNSAVEAESTGSNLVDTEDAPQRVLLRRASRSTHESEISELPADDPNSVAKVMEGEEDKTPSRGREGSSIPLPSSIVNQEDALKVAVEPQNI